MYKLASLGCLPTWFLEPQATRLYDWLLPSLNSLYHKAMQLLWPFVSPCIQMDLLFPTL